MPAIASAYQSRHGEALAEAVKNDTSGDYGKVLLKIIEKSGKDTKQGDKKGTKQEPVREKKPATERQDTKKDDKKGTKQEPIREKKPATERQDKKKDTAPADRRGGQEKKSKEAPAARESDKSKNKNENKTDEKKETEKKKEEEDAVKLFNAMKGLGTGEDTIIEVITRNSNAGRQTLKQRYQTLYKEVRFFLIYWLNPIRLHTVFK